MTDHPNWGQVKQRMEMYLTHTGHIQGKSFEALLSYAIKNSSAADLVDSFQYQGALSNENKQMALQRELWNVTMKAAAADENKAALGCERSYANERAKDSQASIPDCLLPGNQLSVTMKTPLQKKNLEIVNITVISCTAPALDTGLQPEFKAYVFGGNQLQEQKLDEQAYRKSFDCIKNQVLAAAKAHPEANRVALPAIGMNAFLTGLTEQNKKTAIKIGSETLAELAIELRDIGKEVLITDLSNHGIVWQQVNNFLESRKQDPLAFGGPIPGDWITEGMMVLNAWDPHSLVGNGLSNDDSIDGYLGRSTLTHLIHALHCAAYAENIPLDFNPVGS